MLASEQKRDLSRGKDFLRTRLDHLQRAVGRAERQLKVAGVEERKILKLAVLQRRIGLDAKRLRTNRRRSEPRARTETRGGVVRRAKQDNLRLLLVFRRADERGTAHPKLLLR